MPMQNGVWVPDLDGKQWEVFDSNDRALLVSGGRKSGKCVDASTIVQCDGRLRRMGSLCANVEEGQEIAAKHEITAMSGCGFVKATTSALMSNPNPVGLRITTAYGYSLKASTWHPVWSFSDGRFDYRTTTHIKALVDAGKPVWLPIYKGFDWGSETPSTITFPSSNRVKMSVVQVHDRIAEVVARGDCKSWKQIAKTARTHFRAVRAFFKNRRTVEEYSVTINESAAYLLGVLIGDGCMTDACMAKGRVLFATADSEICEWVGAALKEHFPQHRLFRASGYNWQISSPKLNSLVRFLGLNRYSHEKTIPDCILESPKAVLVSFLQGLFDTDGYCSKNGNPSFCSSSELLAKDVQQLLLAFGIISSCRFKPNTRRGAWGVMMYGDNARTFFRTIGFRLQRKQSRQKCVSRTKQEMHYPPDIRLAFKDAYLSRHQRGAPSGNMPRSNKQSSLRKLYAVGGRAISPSVLSNAMKVSFANDNPVLKQFHLGGKVFWDQVTSTGACEVSLFDLSVQKVHNFVANGFINHNSWACLHRIVRHMWETPDARVGIFTKVLKNSKDAGCWKNLHNYTMKQWIGSGIGMQYTTKRYEDEKPGPKVDGTTRTPFFRTTNYHGGESECMLFSLDNPNEAEAKLKEREFSLIYFSELSNFPERSVLSLGLACLRMPYLKFDQQMWMADTNPAPEGESSWIYEVWFIERCLDYTEYTARQKKLNRPSMDEETFNEFKSGLRLIEINAVDNPRLSKRELSELKALYAYDAALHSRFYDGKWIYGGGEKGYHFRNFFKPNIHVAGNCNDPDEDNWEKLNPTPSCITLVTGHDLGETNNHASCIIEKKMLDTYIPETKKTVQRAHFNVIDELVSLDEFVNLEDVTIEFMGLIKELEIMAGREYDLSPAFSDSSTLTKWSAASSSFPSTIVEAASNGRLQLIGVNKAIYTPRWRVNILQILLAFNRIRVSAHCFHVIQMLKNLKKGEGKLNFVLQSDPNRHIFDALTYALISEMAEEIMLIGRDDVATRDLSISIR